MKSPQGWLTFYTGLTVDNNGRDVDEQGRFSVEDVEKNAKSKPKLSKENTSLTSVVNQTNSHFFPFFPRIAILKDLCNLRVRLLIALKS